MSGIVPSAKVNVAENTVATAAAVKQDIVFFRAFMKVLLIAISVVFVCRLSYIVRSGKSMSAPKEIMSKIAQFIHRRICRNTVAFPIRCLCAYGRTMIFTTAVADADLRWHR